MTILYFFWSKLLVYIIGKHGLRYARLKSYSKFKMAAENQNGCHFTICCSTVFCILYLFIRRTKFIETRHFMNHSVRRHLRERRIFFTGFTLPLGVPKWWKNLNFHDFTIFWQFWGHWVNLNMKNHSKPRLFLKYG